MNSLCATFRYVRDLTESPVNGYRLSMIVSQIRRASLKSSRSFGYFIL